MINNYEGIFITKPEMKEEDINNLFKAIGETVTRCGGAIKKEESWGKRQLAYPVKKFKEGYYYKLDFTADPASISKLEEGYKMNPDILRVMITRR